MDNMRTALPTIDIARLVNYRLHDSDKRSCGHAHSAANIINAGSWANSRGACMHESMRRYKTKGKWRDIQAQAVRTLEECTRLGLTLEKPYKWVGEHLYMVRKTGVFAVYNSKTSKGNY